MNRKKITFTNRQLVIISWIIVILSIVVILESAFLLYLKFEKATTHVKVKEIPPVIFNVPQMENSSQIDVNIETEQIKAFEINATSLLNNSFEFADEASKVAIYTLTGKDLERALGSCEGQYFVTEVSTDLYSLVLTKDCKNISKIPQRTVFGIYLLAVGSEGFARAKMLDLREMGLPSFVLHFTRQEKDYYSTVIGAFPSRDMGQSYLKKLNWDEILEKTNLRERGFVGCVINCGD
ncbi:MAG: hypothetical protein J7L34_04420 [Thermotogaceae bacterium]|nr:hypothetical protein [Thermotogaceae bacterium]